MPRPIEIGRDDEQSYVLTPTQRRTHLHILGPSQGGKSRLLEHMIRQDIQAGHGVCLLDPTGNLYKRLALWCAARGMHKRRTIHFFDPNSDGHFIGYNPLLVQPGEPVDKRVETVIAACARAWGEDPNDTPLLKRCLRAIFTVLVEKNLTLAEAIHLVFKPTTKEDQTLFSFLTSTKKTYVQKLWQKYEHMDAKRFEEVFMSSNNRLANFLVSEDMARLFGYGTGSLDLRTCMDEGHIVLVNLQPKRISLENSILLGTLITNELLQLARARDNALAERQPFYTYIDEAYKYLTDDIEQAIDETRQKGLHYILAHQRLSQLRDRGPQIEGGVMSIRNKVIFGGIETVDTHGLAEELFQTQFEENQDIPVLRKMETVRHEIRRNQQWRGGTAEGRAELRGETRARSLNEASNAAISLPFDPLGMLAGDLNQGGGVASAKGQSRAKQYAETANKTKSEMAGWAESAWPVLEERVGALRTYEAQMQIFAKALKAVPKQTVYLKLREREPQLVPIPYVGDPVTHERRLPSFFDSAASISQFTVPKAQADVRLQQRAQDLLQQAQQWRDGPVLEKPDDFFS